MCYLENVHPCQDKCSEFKSEPCRTCLIHEPVALFVPDLEVNRIDMVEVSNEP